MPNLIVIGHVEQAFGDQSNRLFGFTFSVGWSENTSPAHAAPEATHPLFPWTWSNIHTIQLLGKDASGGWAPIKKYPVITADSSQLDHLKSSAHARFQDPATSVRWTDPSATIAPLQVSNSSAPWTAQLAELATSPYPVAQGLNLSFAFKVPVADVASYSLLTAYPVIAKDLNGTTEMQFGAFLEASNGGGYLSSTDAGNLNYGVIAMCNLIPMALPNRTSDWDPQVQRIPLASVSTTDWQANFLVGASRLFALSDFLLFMLMRSEGGIDAKYIPTALDACVASIRDVIGLGTELGPQASFDDLSEMMGKYPALGNETRTQAYANAFPTLLIWKRQLAKILPKLSDALIWKSYGRDSLTLSEAARADNDARLTRETAAVLSQISENDENGTFQRGLMLAHWDAVLNAMTQTPQTMRDTFRKDLSNHLAQRPYPIDWLDDLAGLFWANILDNPSNDANPFLNRTKELSMIFLLTRLGMQIDSSDTPTNLSNNWRWRTVPMDWLPTGTDLQGWQNLKGFFQQSIKEWQDTISAGFAHNSAPHDAASRNPLPIHLQFASFSRNHASSGAVDAGSDDFFRSIRGVGLLVREQSSGPWYNVSRNAVVDSAGELLYPDPVGIAQRPVYASELRRSLLSYDSSPCAGGTALDRIKQLEKAMESEDTVRDPLLHTTYHDDVQVPQTKYGRTFQYVTFGVLNSAIVPPDVRSNANEPRAWASTVPHNPASALLSHPDPLPYLHQRTTRIGALRILGDDPELTKGSKQGLPVIPDETFPRGRDLHWADLWASLQQNVRPADPSLPLALLTPTSWLSPDSPARNSYTFRVNLPEVTWKEWACWGASLPPRSKGGGLPTSGVVIPLDKNVFMQDREDVIADAFEKCLQTSEDPSFLPALDDPCLERMLYFELLQEIDGVLQVVKTESLRIDDASGTTGLKKYQSLGATVVCKHADAALSNLNPVAATRTMNVFVKEGQVCLLRIWACLPAEYQLSDPTSAKSYSAMFASNSLPMKVPLTLGGRNFLVVSPYDLILEGASDALPEGLDLFKCFSIGYELDQSDYAESSVSARLQPEVADRPRAIGGKAFQGPQTDPGFTFLNIGRAEVRRQSWRWMGRPVPLHPVLTGFPTASFDAEEQKWVAGVYGEVPDMDSLKARMVISKKSSTNPNVQSLERRGCRFFEYAEVLGSSAGAVKADQDRRGAHYRFSLCAFNRYESLLAYVPNVSAVRYAHPALDAPGVLTPPSPVPHSLAWKNSFVPSRIPTPQIPRIRVVLPLTEAYERSESRSPGLLAVFDDIWYDDSGLGESLEAEIEIVQYKGKLYQQFGKDIFLRGTNERPSLEPFSSLDSRPAVINLTLTDPHPKWAGPVGHFKDFENRYARFLGTSFIIPAPTNVGKSGPIDARYAMGNIRFRKVLYSRDLPPGAAPGSPRKKVSYSGLDIQTWKSAIRRSGWTDTCWVQLLPEFSRFDDFTAGDHRIADLVTHIDPATGAVTLKDGVNGKGVRLLPTQSPLHPDGFRLYAVLTQRAYDFRGQYNQELYIATLAQETGSPNWRSTSRLENIKALTAECRVRILEVQLPTARIPDGSWPSDPEDIWDAMSQVKRKIKPDVIDGKGRPWSSAFDALGRIVRISEPANSVVRDLCEINEVQK